MRVTVLLLCLLAVESFAAEPSAPPERPRLAIADFTAVSVSTDDARAITDAVVTYLSGRGLFEVIGPRDVETLIGAERQRQLSGVCADDPTACSADMMKLINARFVLSGQLARVGSAWQLTMQLLDTAQSRANSRSSKLASSLEDVRSLVPWAASEATGSPLPAPPSRVPAITLISVGGVSTVVGGVVGLLALSRQVQLNDELCPGGIDAMGRCNTQSLQPRAHYVGEQTALDVQKVLSVSLMAVGVVMVGLGIWLMPADDARTRISLRVTPTLDGFAFAGGF